MIIHFGPPWILYTRLTSRKQHVCWLGKIIELFFILKIYIIRIRQKHDLLQIFWEPPVICHSWNHSLTQEMVYLWGAVFALEALFPFIKCICSSVWYIYSDQSFGMPWLFYSYLYCYDMAFAGWQIAVYNDSVLVVLFIVYDDSFLQLSWFVLLECNFRKVGWVLSLSVNCGSVEACWICYSMCRTSKLQEWKRNGGWRDDQHSLILPPEKKWPQLANLLLVYLTVLKFKNRYKVVKFQRKHFGRLFVRNQCNLIHLLIYIFGAYPLFILRKTVYRLKAYSKLKELLLQSSEWDSRSVSPCLAHIIS